MTDLKCKVKNCMHNADCCCCKQTIMVEGSEAQKCSETCCGSFCENTDGSFSNLFKNPETRLEIECDARNCIYNADRYCNAEHIEITGFAASQSGDTECKSFKAK